MNIHDVRLPERFWSKVIPEPNSGCWLWLGSTNPAGYGRFSSNGRHLYPHRVTYQTSHGAVPEGLVVDHLCRNTLCCNPAHLEAVTQGVNVRRGRLSETTKDGALKRTHCANGHEWTPGNIVTRTPKRRDCRTCANARRRKVQA